MYAYGAALRKDWLILSVIILAGTLLRIDFLCAGNWMIDADEAIVGLMGLHFSTGRPITTFYYGQHYMGSLEPLLVALSFLLGGVSAVTLKLVPLIFSLLLVPVVYLIGLELLSVRIARLAALFMAIPPVGLVVWGSKARGGFIELLLIGALALLFTLRTLKKEHPSIRDTVVVGLLVGVGFWVNNQILYFVPAIGLAFIEIVGWGRLSLLRQGAAGTAAFLLGSLPYWIYNLRNDFASFGLFSRSTPMQIWSHVEGLFLVALPSLIGAKRFWTESPLFPGAVPLILSFYGALIVWIIWQRRAHLPRLFIGRVDRKRPIELPLILVFSCAAIFCVSAFGWLAAEPRYLLPLYVGLVIVTAWGLDRAASITPVGGASLVIMLVAFNLCSAFYGGRAIPGEPFVFDGERVSKDHGELIEFLRERRYDFVETNYWIGYRLAFETREAVRFEMFQEPWTVRIPAYETEAQTKSREAVPMILTPKQGSLVKRALTVLGLSYEETLRSGYTVLFNIRSTTPDGELIRPEEFAVETSHAPSEAAMAFDGLESTRWATHTPQSPGQRFTVRFKVPTSISGIEVDLGDWGQDFPRGLSVESIDAAGTVRPVVAPEYYEALVYYLSRRRPFLIRQILPEVSSLTLTQIGRHPIFDWSIAELRLYRDSQ